MKCATAGGWNKGKANGRKRSRSLLWLVTLTRSCCAQRQSIRHLGLLLMSAGNKSEEAGLYFAAWLPCRSRHRPAYPSKTDTFRAQSHPLGISASRLHVPIYLIYSLLDFFSSFAAGPSCAFHYLSQMFLLWRRCLVYMLWVAEHRGYQSLSLSVSKRHSWCQ